VETERGQVRLLTVKAARNRYKRNETGPGGVDLDRIGIKREGA
jgi:hypothetical protein